MPKSCKNITRYDNGNVKLNNLLMYYIQFIFNLIIFNKIIFLLFAILFFIMIGIFAYTFNKNYKITFEDFIIYSIWPLIFKTLLFFGLYFLLFVYLRLINIQKLVDLKLIIYNFFVFFENNGIFTFILKILLVIILIFIAINIIIPIRKYFYYHFLQIFLYSRFWTREPEGSGYPKYERFLDKIDTFVKVIPNLLSLIDFFEFIYSIMYKIYIRKNPEYTKRLESDH